MFCPECLKKLYCSLGNSDLAVVYYLKKRTEQIEKVVDKSLINKIVQTEVTEAKIISVLKNDQINSYNIKESLIFLRRLGFVSRKRADHSWLYFLSESGNCIADMLMKDKKTKEKIFLLIKEKD